MSTEFEVVPASAIPPAALVEVLSSAFEREFTLEWFEWKHRDAPWGQAEGWAARDESGLVGLRLFTPWQIRHGAETLVARRAMNGATVPRARRRGVFERLVRAEMESVAREDAALLFSTAVPASRAAYEKSGWTTIGAIPHTLGTRPRRPAAQIEIGLDTIGAPPAIGDRIQTNWTEDALHWRTDARSGFAYERARLVQGGSANGLISRIAVRSRFRILVVVASWGSRRDVRELIGSVAATHGCGLVLEAAGCGARSPRATGIARRRGSSTVTLLASGSLLQDWQVHDQNRWALTLADLEGVL